MQQLQELRLHHDNVLWNAHVMLQCISPTSSSCNRCFQAYMRSLLMRPSGEALHCLLHLVLGEIFLWTSFKLFMVVRSAIRIQSSLESVGQSYASMHIDPANFFEALWLSKQSEFPRHVQCARTVRSTFKTFLESSWPLTATQQGSSYLLYLNS